MSDKHLKLIFEAQPNVTFRHLQDQLRRHGYEAMPMTVGVLLAGKQTDLQRLLPRLTGDGSGAPVPAELEDSPSDPVCTAAGLRPYLLPRRPMRLDCALAPLSPSSNARQSSLPDQR